MKIFFHRVSGEKKISLLKSFFHRLERIERKSYSFYSNSPQILHLLAIFSGDTSTREEVSYVFLVIMEPNMSKIFLRFQISFGDKEHTVLNALN